MTIDEAATRLHVSPRSLLREAAKRRFPAEKVADTWVVREADIERCHAESVDVEYGIDQAAARFEHHAFDDGLKVLLWEILGDSHCPTPARAALMRCYEHVAAAVDRGSPPDRANACLPAKTDSPLIAQLQEPWSGMVETLIRAMTRERRSVVRER